MQKTTDLFIPTTEKTDNSYIPPLSDVVRVLLTESLVMMNILKKAPPFNVKLKAAIRHL